MQLFHLDVHIAYIKHTSWLLLELCHIFTNSFQTDSTEKFYKSDIVAFFRQVWLFPFKILITFFLPLKGIPSLLCHSFILLSCVLSYWQTLINSIVFYPYCSTSFLSTSSAKVCKWRSAIRINLSLLSVTLDVLKWKYDGSVLQIQIFWYKICNVFCHFHAVGPIQNAYF